jgi:hypothetical protein
MVTMIKRDLSELGGPMGTERIKIIWRKNFNNEAEARLYAERDHGENIPKIKWSESQFDNLYVDSNDLLSHNYSIFPLKIEQVNP